MQRAQSGGEAQPDNLSSALPAEPRHCVGALPERPCHRGLRETVRPHLVLNKHRQEGMGKVDKRGTHRTAQTDV